MSDAEATVLGAVIAAIALLAVALLSAVVALIQERRRRREERNATEALEIRRRAADVFTLMFAMQHEIEWMTWHAVNDRAALSQRMTENYHRTIHSIYPKLLGSMAVVCAFDETLYDSLKPLADDLYGLDIEVAQAARDLREDDTKESAVKALEKLDQHARNLYEQLPRKMAQSMHLAAHSTPRKALLTVLSEKN